METSQFIAGIYPGALGAVENLIIASIRFRNNKQSIST